MMTFKQESYIKALMEQKEYEMTANMEYYVTADKRSVTKEDASSVIEYLLTCLDKAEKSNAEQIIKENSKAILRALNNKKKKEFSNKVMVFNENYKVRFSNKNLYLEDANEEQLNNFLELAKKYVKALNK